jgi:hypothetical protein
VPGREADALELYRSLLGRSSVAEAAFVGLESLLLRLGRHTDRAELLAERIAHSTGERRDRMRLDLATTHWRHLQNATEAVGILTELLASAGDEPPARAVELLESLWGEGSERPKVYRLLEPIYQANEDWDKLVALYVSTLEQDDPELQIECLTKLAELENVRLDKPVAAFTTLFGQRHVGVNAAVDHVAIHAHDVGRLAGVLRENVLGREIAVAHRVDVIVPNRSRAGEDHGVSDIVLLHHVFEALEQIGFEFEPQHDDALKLALDGVGVGDFVAVEHGVVIRRFRDHGLGDLCRSDGGGQQQ